MKLKNLNNHVVIELKDGNYVVDTGSPISFSYKAIDEIEIEGNKYPISESIKCEKAVVDKLTGGDISGFIGMDIINKTGIQIDYVNSEIKFNCEEFNNAYTFSTIDLLGCIRIDNQLSFNGKLVNRVVLDTGAKDSYVSRELIGDNKLDETYDDYSPTLRKELTGNYYEVAVDVPYQATFKAGIMDNMLKMVGDAIINPNVLGNAICIDPKSKTFKVKL